MFNFLSHIIVWKTGFRNLKVWQDWCVPRNDDINVIPGTWDNVSISDTQEFVSQLA